MLFVGPNSSTFVDEAVREVSLLPWRTSWCHSQGSPLCIVPPHMLCSVVGGVGVAERRSRASFSSVPGLVVPDRQGERWLQREGTGEWRDEGSRRSVRYEQRQVGEKKQARQSPKGGEEGGGGRGGGKNVRLLSIGSLENELNVSGRRDRRETRTPAAINWLRRGGNPPMLRASTF